MWVLVLSTTARQRAQATDPPLASNTVHRIPERLLRRCVVEPDSTAARAAVELHVADGHAAERSPAVGAPPEVALVVALGHLHVTLDDGHLLRRRLQRRRRRVG